MTKKEYAVYLKLEHWISFKKEIIKNGGVCQKCGNNKLLSVHHLNYNNFGNEKLEDVQILCNKCHYIEGCKLRHIPKERQKNDKSLRTREEWKKEWEEIKNNRVLNRMLSKKKKEELHICNVCYDKKIWVDDSYRCYYCEKRKLKMRELRFC